MTRGEKKLDMVETIYEDDQEEATDSCSASPPHSPSSSLKTVVDEWTRTTGSEPDIFVCVQDQSFRLHIDPLVRRSGYLKRRLTDSSSATVYPPSNITAGILASVFRFCYTGDISITPFNVAALRVAAGWLELTADNNDGRAPPCDVVHGGDGDGIEYAGGNLVERADQYFFHAISASPEYAAIVLRTCAGLLQGDEEGRAAVLAGRCVEVLALAFVGHEGKGSWLDDVGFLAPEEFRVITATMVQLLPDSHDLIYTVVDHYVNSYKGDLSEEDMYRICCAIDCQKLSRPRRIELVRDPKMPLRFIVQAMLAEQSQTRRALLEGSNNATLGTILERDMALRQIRAALEATSFRLQNLEEQVSEMKVLLERRRGDQAAPGRSESLRFFGEEERALLEKKLKKNGRKGFVRKLIDGFMKLFQTSSSPRKCLAGHDVGDENVTSEWATDRVPRRSRSFG